MSIDGTNNNTLLPFSRLSRPSFQDSLFWPVQLSRSVGLKCPFPLDKNIVPSTVLLYPTYKINKQTRSGLGWVCTTGIYRSIGHVEFPKFQTRLFVEWKSLTVLTVFFFTVAWLYHVTGQYIILLSRAKVYIHNSWEELLWSRSLACESSDMYKVVYTWRGSKLKITPVKFMWEDSLNS